MGRDGRRLRLVQGTCRSAADAQRSLEADSRKGLPSKPASAKPCDLSQALRASEQRLSALLEDRGRIGRDLHDCVLQSLYAIGLGLAQSRRLGSTVSRASRPSGHDVVDQLNTLIQDIRRMITGLERGIVEDFDLSSELRRLIQTYSHVGHLHISLQLQPAAVEILTGEEEQEILNIVREALSNCGRHACATHATVALQTRGDRVRLIIHDNGIGFEPDKKPVAGYGLANMAARAKKLGGSLTIRSRIGGGTTVLAEFVLEPLLKPV